jgi:hypothetical protein
MLHYVEDSQFTCASWSLTQPSVVFLADEAGRLQIWDITSPKSTPFQTQEISGCTINGKIIGRNFRIKTVHLGRTVNNAEMAKRSPPGRRSGAVHFGYVAESLKRAYATALMTLQTYVER